MKYTLIVLTPYPGERVEVVDQLLGRPVGDQGIGAAKALHQELLPVQAGLLAANREHGSRRQ
jgi:hypothetical protein